MVLVIALPSRKIILYDNLHRQPQMLLCSPSRKNLKIFCKRNPVYYLVDSVNLREMPATPNGERKHLPLFDACARVLRNLLDRITPF